MGKLDSITSKSEGDTEKMGVGRGVWMYYREIRSPVGPWEGVFHPVAMLGGVLLGKGTTMAKNEV